MKVIFKVPRINAQIPYLGSELVGFQSLVKRNSVIETRVKNVIVSVINVNNIPIVVKIEMAAIIPKIIGTILSENPPFLALFLAIISLTLVLEAIYNPLFLFLPIDFKKRAGNYQVTNEFKLI